MSHYYQNLSLNLYIACKALHSLAIHFLLMYCHLPPQTLRSLFKFPPALLSMVYSKHGFKVLKNIINLILYNKYKTS